MHSRVTRFKVPPDKFDLVIGAMQARVDAGAQRHEDFHGFAGETLLMDHEREEALLIVYYQDKASMALSAERARHLLEQIAGGLGVQVISVSEYAVAVSDMPLPITPG